jgi:hypothetical protein
MFPDPYFIIEAGCKNLDHVKINTANNQSTFVYKLASYDKAIFAPNGDNFCSFLSNRKDVCHLPQHRRGSRKPSLDARKK